ncbi:MAG: sulfatase-modifying factor protein, partial [Cyanobacteria bacterium P01_A01_bin.135]
MRCRLAPLIALVIVGCSRSPSPEQLAEQQSRCESKDGFVWVEGGDYLAGSDTAERDYGYRVSAEAVADEPEAIARAEAQLRQRGWFDREPERQTASLPGFCLSQFLTTNQDYQEFVVATGHRAPGISAADYQAQGFLV